jgi:hypothetical protein
LSGWCPGRGVLGKPPMRVKERESEGRHIMMNDVGITIVKGMVELQAWHLGGLHWRLVLVSIG